MVGKLILRVADAHADLIEDLRQILLGESEQLEVGAIRPEAEQQLTELVVLPLAHWWLSRSARSLASCSGMSSTIAGTVAMPRCCAARYRMLPA